MTQGHAVEDLLGFLEHAGKRGLMPVATAQALAVAARSVFSVLDDTERANLSLDDLDDVVRRFNHQRSGDVNPGSLKEYARRVRRAVEMYRRWKSDPANFSVKTRVTVASQKAGGRSAVPSGPPVEREPEATEPPSSLSGSAIMTPSGFQTAFPVRAGHVVTVSNIPLDLTTAEAERLAQFIRLLTPG